MNQVIAFSGGAAVALTAFAAVAQTSDASVAAANAKPMACEQLTTLALGLPNVRIISAQAAPSENGLPAACIVRGRRTNA
jgi:hypothetical protein